MSEFSQELPIKPPRPIWHEVILHLSTFGMYTCFWFYSVARDLNRSHGQHNNPYLWFCVPLVFIAQIFALPRFVKLLETAETEVDISPWSKGQNGLWIAAVIIITAIISLSDRIEIRFSWLILTIAVWAIALSIMHVRVNRIRANSKGPFRKLRAGFTIPEWIVLVVLVPFISFSLWTISIHPYLAKTNTIVVGDTLSDQDKKIQLTISQSDWYQVEVGTHSDGSALFELSGPSDFLHFVSFKHDSNYTLNDIAQWRIASSHEELSNAQCSEDRKFIEDTLIVTSFVECSGKEMLDPTLYTHKLIQMPDGIYELYGYYSAVEGTFKHKKQDFLTLAKGLKPYEK